MGQATRTSTTSCPQTRITLMVGSTCVCGTILQARSRIERKVYARYTLRTYTSKAPSENIKVYCNTIQPKKESTNQEPPRQQSASSEIQCTQGAVCELPRMSG